MLRSFCLVILICLWPAFARAEIYLYAPDSPQAQGLAVNIADALTDYSPEVISQQQPFQPDDILISIGSDYLQGVSNLDQIQVIVISPSSHITLPETVDHPTCFVYQVDPNSLVSSLAKRFTKAKIGYLYSRDDDPLLPAFSLNEGGIELVSEKVTGDVFKHLRRLREQGDIDLMLISNDLGVYNSRNIRFVLEDLYRHRIPAISMSSNLLNAGAAVAFVPEASEFAEQVADVVKDLLSNASPNDDMYFAGKGRIEFNERMAQRYDLGEEERWQ